MATLLTKSTFMRGVQCEKSLFLHHHRPQWRDRLPADQRARFARGQAVGRLARQLFPGGADASAASGAAKLRRTQALLAAGQRVLYEASFAFEGVQVQLDILVHRDDGWHAYEVKSALKVSPAHELDAALQHYVITQSGLPLADIHLLHLDRQYVRESKLQLDALFTARSLGDLARHNQPFVAGRIAALQAVLAQPEVPLRDIGTHCRHPYPCDFVGHCWQHLPRPSVFDVVGLSERKQFDLYYTGTQALRDVPEAVMEDFHQRIQQQAARSGQPVVEAEALFRYLDTLTPPLYFLHWEALRPAVPLVPGTRPYQYLPALFGLQFIRADTDEVRSVAWLAPPPLAEWEWTPDPRRTFVAQLLHYTRVPGAVVTYRAEILRTLLEAISYELPDLAPALTAWLPRLRDLSLPFSQKFYYEPRQQGRHDWATVQQVLVPTPTSLPFANEVVARQAYQQWQPARDLFGEDALARDLQTYLRGQAAAQRQLWQYLRTKLGMS